MNQTVTYRNSKDVVSSVNQKRANRISRDSGTLDCSKYKIAMTIPNIQLWIGLIMILAMFVGQFTVGDLLRKILLPYGLIADVTSLGISFSLIESHPDDYVVSLRKTVVVFVLKLFIVFLFSVVKAFADGF